MHSPHKSYNCSLNRKITFLSKIVIIFLMGYTLVANAQEISGQKNRLQMGKKWPNELKSKES